MAKIVADKVSAMSGPINTAVKAWLIGQGIKLEDVRGYTLTYDAGNLMTIDVRMFMEDVAPKPEDVEAPAIHYPALVRDAEDDLFHHQGDGVYRMLNNGHPGESAWTLDEIGEHVVIEA